MGGSNGADTDDKILEELGLVGRDDDDEVPISIRAIKVLHRHTIRLDGLYQDLASRLARVDEESERRYEANVELSGELKKHREAMADTAKALGELGHGIKATFASAEVTHNKLAGTVEELTTSVKVLSSRMEAIELVMGRKTVKMPAVDVEKMRKHSKKE